MLLFFYAHVLLYWCLRCRICQSCQECLVKKLLSECLFWASEFLIAFDIYLRENQLSVYKLFREHSDNSEFFLVFIKQSWYWKLLKIICKTLIEALCYVMRAYNFCVLNRFSENYIMRNLVICTPYPILCGW